MNEPNYTFSWINDSIVNQINYTDVMNGTSFSDIMKTTTSQLLFYLQYITIFMLGVVGNCLVCYVVFRNKHMQTVTNYFIANLALADILLCTLAVPFTPLYFFRGEWIFGSVLCRLLPWSQGISVYVSTLTLTSIAIDRYFVILYPFRPRMRLPICYFIIVSIWVFSISATIPYAFYISQSKHQGRFYCEERWPSEVIRCVFSLFTTVMQFFVPFLAILFCYVKISINMSERVKSKPGSKTSRKEEADRERNKRTNRMLIAMVSIFGISWLPINLIHLIQDYYAPTGTWPYINLVFFLTHVVAMSSTCYNPFLYTWLNESFRKEFQLVLPCFWSRSSSTNIARCIQNTLSNETTMEVLKDRSSSPDIRQQKVVDERKEKQPYNEHCESAL